MDPVRASSEANNLSDLLNRRNPIQQNPDTELAAREGDVDGGDPVAPTRENALQ
jgi:hypothetical protein